MINHLSFIRNWFALLHLQPDACMKAMESNNLNGKVKLHQPTHKLLVMKSVLMGAGLGSTTHILLVMESPLMWIGLGSTTHKLCQVVTSHVNRAGQHHSQTVGHGVSSYMDRVGSTTHSLMVMESAHIWTGWAAPLTP